MGDAVAFCPPLITTAAQVDEIFARFDAAMTRFEASAQ
jgi:4-aminobutyrate--pyruvate transaminase